MIFKFIKKILIFLLPIVIVAIAIELFYRFSDNDFKVKNELIHENYDKSEVLIFGNSHPFYGLNPEYFDRPTLNTAIISQTLYYDYLIFNKHIDNFSNLKCVILHVEYTSLFEKVENEANQWRKYYYKHFMELPIPNDHFYNYQNYMLSWTRNLKSNYKLIKDYYSNGTLVYCDNNGFGTNYTFSNRKEITKKSALKRYKAIEDNSLEYHENLKVLEEFIAKCKSKNIKVAFVTLPNTKEFYSLFRSDKLQKMETTLNTLSNNNNVLYLNLLKDKRFSNEDFFDEDHLNDKGAIKSSMIVNQFLLDRVFKN